MRKLLIKLKFKRQNLIFLRMREIKINGSITSACKTFFHRDLASTYTKKKKPVLVSHVMNLSDDSVAKD